MSTNQEALEPEAEYEAQLAILSIAPRLEQPSYVLNSYKWGSGVRGTSGGTITWTFSSQLPSTSTFTADAIVVPAEYQATIRAAFARWNQVGNFQFVEVTDGLNANIHVAFDELLGQGSSTLGLTYSRYSSTGSEREAYISFDIGRRYRTADGTVYSSGSVSSTSTIYNIYSIALHEIGHALGLGHENDFATLMNSFYSPNINDITNDEINGIQALYGATGSSTPTSDDYASNTATTGRITVGSSALGNIETGSDSDWFAVTLTAGTSYRFDVIGGTLLDPYLYVRNSGGSLVASDDDSGVGLNSQLTYTPALSGTYYVEVRGATSSDIGSYLASVTAVTSGGSSGGSSGGRTDDYTASTSTTGRVTVGSSVTGNIDYAYDEDWFAVTFTAGAVYRINLDGITITDPYLFVYDDNGNLLTGDDDSGAGLNSQLTYAATRTGTYYLSSHVATRATDPTATGSYRLSVTAVSTPAPVGPTDDFAAGPNTVGRIAIGGSLTGNIETGLDTDWFKVTLEAGVMYRCKVAGSAAGGGTLSSPLATLYNDAGRTESAAGGAVNELVFTPTVRGTYYLAASGSGADVTGTYTVSASAVADDYAANTATTGALTVGSTRTGSIDAAYDTDWFRVTLNANGRYRFFVSGADGNGGTLASPRVRIYDSSGSTMVASAEIGGGGYGADALLLYSPTQAGTYFVSVSNVGSATGTYTVGVRAQTVDDYSADTSTAGRIAAGGTASGTIEATGDHDWFRTVLQAGTTYEFDVVGTAPGSGLREADAYFVVRGAAGEERAQTEAHGTSIATHLTYTATVTELAYLDVQAYTMGSGTYIVSMRIASGSALETDVDGLQAPDIAAVTAAPAFDLSQLAAPPSPVDLLAADPYDPTKRLLPPGTPAFQLYADTGGVPV